MRATLTDVAREAGVSAATVDRVLNNRSGVRGRTRQIVLETAQRLGYIADEANGHARPANIPSEIVRLDFALPAGTNPFMQTLRAELEEQGLQRDGVEVHIASIEGFDPEALARTLQDLKGKTQGVGVIALDHPIVREAIRTLSASGVKVVTIASDILQVPRVAYVGIDNRAAGRLAGYMVNRFVRTQSGKVALFAGSLAYRGHEEREMGFRHILNEEARHLHIVEMREMLDDREKAYTEAAALLDRHPDLAAVYNVGAGNTGIARALKERGRQNDVVFIGHDVTEGTKELLLDGTLDAVIDQNPRVEAREALNILTSSIQGRAYDGHPPRLQVIFRENIPET